MSPSTSFSPLGTGSCLGNVVVTGVSAPFCFEAHVVAASVGFVEGAGEER